MIHKFPAVCVSLLVITGYFPPLTFKGVIDSSLVIPVERPIILALLFLKRALLLFQLPTWRTEVTWRLVLKHADVIDALTLFYDKLIFTFLMLKQAYYHNFPVA